MIIKISNEDNHLEMIMRFNKLVESINRDKIIVPVRNEFLDKYQESKSNINDNTILYDFKNKLLKNVLDFDNYYHY